MNLIHDLFNNRAARKVLLTLRVPLVLGIGALLIAQIQPECFWPALLVSMVGELGQLWCFGALKKQKVLAVKGPYLLVRNPMYLARYFIILGALMLAGNAWLLLGYTVAYYYYMVNRVRREEAVLRPLFGAEYDRYCAEVPRFVPDLGRLRTDEVFFFRRDYFLANHGHWNLLGLVAFYAVGYVVAFPAPSSPQP